MQNLKAHLAARSRWMKNFAAKNSIPAAIYMVVVAVVVVGGNILTATVYMHDCKKGLTCSEMSSCSATPTAFFKSLSLAHLQQEQQCSTESDYINVSSTCLPHIGLVHQYSTPTHLALARIKPPLVKRKLLHQGIWIDNNQS